VSTFEVNETTGDQLRPARLYIGLSMSQMAERTNYSKAYLGLVETGVKPATLDVVTAYQRVLGDGMWRKDIKHPRLRKIEGSDDLARVLAAVESGDPDIFAKGPTSSSIDAAVAPRLSATGVANFRRWVVEGKTSTLRANAVSILGFLPGRENAELVVQVLESDEKVRRLSLASEVSRLMQLDWETSLRVADDPTTAPNPKKLGARLAKEAIDPKDSESRWCAGNLLQRMAPALSR
jgi:transcriptional regulator with XRE-family HTH domain